MNKLLFILTLIPVLLSGQSTFEGRKDTTFAIYLAGSKGWQGSLAEFIDDPTNSAYQDEIVRIVANPHGDNTPDEQAVIIGCWAIGLHRNVFSTTELDEMQNAIAGWNEVTGYGTENHGLMKQTEGNLFAQFFPGESWASYNPPGPLTSSELKEETKENLIDIISSYYEKGYEEVLSTTYDMLHIHPLLALYSLSDDEELQNAAEAGLAYIFANRASSNFDGVTVAPYKRPNYWQPNLMTADDNGVNCKPTDWIMWPDATNNYPNSNWNSASANQSVYTCISDYVIPLAIQKLAKKDSGFYKASYCDFASYGDGQSHDLMKHQYKTDNYAIGTGFNQYAPERGYYATHRNHIVYKTSDVWNILMWKHKYWASDWSEYDAWKECTASLFEQTTLDTNTVISLYNIPSADPWNPPVGSPSTYTSRDGHYNNLIQRVDVLYPDGMDSVVLGNNNWCFFNEGETYIAVNFVSTEYILRDVASVSNHDILKSSAAQNALIIDVGDADTYGTFAEFKTAIYANSIVSDLSVPEVTYTKSNGSVLKCSWDDINYADENVSGNRIIVQPDVWRNGVKDERFAGSNWPDMESPFISLDNRVLNIVADGEEYQIDWSGTSPAFSDTAEIPDPNAADYTNYNTGGTYVAAYSFSAEDEIRGSRIQMPESGYISSMSIYHSSDSGNVIAGLYSDSSATPKTLLTTATATPVNTSEGWQTLYFNDTIQVSGGEYVWAAYGFEHNATLYYEPSSVYKRTRSVHTYSDGMPSDFIETNIADYIYSMYLTYQTDLYTPAGPCDGEDNWIPEFTVTHDDAYPDSTGAISVNWTGFTGTPPYTYQWGLTGGVGFDYYSTKDISNLVGNKYYFPRIKDANDCEAPHTLVLVDILDPENIVITGVVTPVTSGQSDGAIDITATGGIEADYEYSWSNGEETEDISGLSAGEYSVIVLDGYDYSYDTFIVAEDCPVYDEFITVTTENDTANLGLGKLNRVWSGDVWVTSTQWSGDFSSTDSILTAHTGIYDFTITCNDINGCIYDSTFNDIIVSNVTPTDIVISGTVTASTGSDGAIDVSHTGGFPPYVYEWSNGATTQDITGLAAGDYTVTVTGKYGTTEPKTFTVEDISNPCYGVNILLTYDVSLIVNDVPVTIDLSVSGGTAPYVYSWSTEETTQDITVSESGEYTVTVTDNDDCTSQTTINVNEYIEPTPSEIKIYKLNDSTEYILQIYENEKKLLEINL